ncbi:beta-lactamase/transpeptidase-like protein, partial [Blastocladiella britannica]
MDPSIETAIAQALEAAQVPGASMAVVHNGNSVLCRGFGTRSFNDGSDGITPSALFCIGSLTKSFTAACVGVLVHQGKLSWTEPIRTYLPEFETQSEIATRSATVVDLLAHRLGLVSPDWLWHPSIGSDSRQTTASHDIVGTVAHLPTVPGGFRNSFEYSNQCLALVVVVIERVSG